MRIDTARANDYIRENFSLDGTASRLCAAVFDYWNGYCCDDSISAYLTELLDPIGFDGRDVDRMVAEGIIAAE